VTVAWTVDRGLGVEPVAVADIVKAGLGSGVRGGKP